MARTVVYPGDLPAPPPAPITFGGPGGAKRSADATQDSDEGDDYATKVVKFVPAEVLAFFAPAAAALEERTALLVAAAGIALLATPGYLWLGARKLPRAKKPLVHLYPLSALAFLAWAVATTAVGNLIGLDELETSFILGATVFVIPLVDGVLADLLSPRSARRKR